MAPGEILFFFSILEMGRPIDLSRTSRSRDGLAHIQDRSCAPPKTSTTRVPLHDRLRLTNGRCSTEPVDVVGMITPWNWRLKPVTLKANARGACRSAGHVILKPSEVFPPVGHLVCREMIDRGGPFQKASSTRQWRRSGRSARALEHVTRMGHDLIHRDRPARVFFPGPPPDTISASVLRLAARGQNIILRRRRRRGRCQPRSLLRGDEQLRPVLNARPECCCETVGIYDKAVGTSPLEDCQQASAVWRAQTRKAAYGRRSCPRRRF